MPSMQSDLDGLTSGSAVGTAKSGPLALFLAARLLDDRNHEEVLTTGATTRWPARRSACLGAVQ